MGFSEKSMGRLHWIGTVVSPVPQVFLNWVACMSQGNRI